MKLKNLCGEVGENPCENTFSLAVCKCADKEPSWAGFSFEDAKT